MTSDVPILDLPEIEQDQLKQKEIVKNEDSIIKTNQLSLDIEKNVQLTSIKNIPNGIHLLCMILSLVLLIIFVFRSLQIYCLRNNIKTGVCFSVENYPIINLLFIVIYIIYLIEVFKSSTFKFLRKKEKEKGVRDYIELMKQTDPYIEQISNCYNFYCDSGHINQMHVELTPTGVKKHTTVESVSFGRNLTKIFTFRFYYKYAKDLTGDLGDLFTNNNLVMLNFKTDIELGDNKTKQYFYEQKNLFLKLFNEARCDYEYKQDKFIPHFRERILGIGGKQSSSLIHWFPFIAASFLFLSWPYRIFFNSRCCSIEMTFKKRVFS